MSVCIQGRQWRAGDTAGLLLMFIMPLFAQNAVCWRPANDIY